MKTIACLLTALILVVLQQPAPATSEEKQARPAREVVFPQDYSIGTVSLMVPSATTFGHIKSLSRTKALGPAQGKISVPAGTYLGLEGNARFFSHCQALDKLKPDDIDRLTIRFSALADEEEKYFSTAIKKVSRLTGLRELLLTKSDISDKLLADINSLTNLQWLDCNLTAVDGSFMEHLQQLKELRILRFSESSIDERNLKYLSNFPKLEMLELERCRIGSVGLSYIAKTCPNLINLELTGDTQVDDRAIEKIGNLKKLGFLSLGGTSVTTAGLIKLKGCTALKTVSLPKSNYSTSDLRDIKKSLPHATLFPTKRQAQDQDNAVLFAPLH
jgi:hypothetical protein